MNDNRARHAEQPGGHEKTLDARRWLLRLPLIALLGAVACGDSSTVAPPPEEPGEEDAGLDDDVEVDEEPARDASVTRRSDAGPDAGPSARSDAGARPDAGPAARGDAAIANPPVASPGAASPAPAPPGAIPPAASPDGAGAQPAQPGGPMPAATQPGGTDGQPAQSGTAMPAAAAPMPSGGMAAPFCAQRKAKWRVSLTVRNDSCFGTNVGTTEHREVDLENGASALGMAANLPDCRDQSVEPADECSIRVDLDCPSPPPLPFRGRLTGTLSFGTSTSFSGVLRAQVSGLPLPCEISFDATGARSN